MTDATTQVYKVHINASPQVVWETLTREGEVLPFFFNSVMHTTGLAVGAPMHMRTPNGKYTGVVGRILEFNPPWHMSQTFRFTNYDDPECIVSYDLKEVPGGTEFTLTTTNLPLGTKTAKQMHQGGDFIVKTLKGIIENGKPPMASRFVLTMIKMFGFMTPRRCLSSNWPLE